METESLEDESQQTTTKISKDEDKHNKNLLQNSN